MSEELTSWKGNGLSDQPETVRKQVLGQVQAQLDSRAVPSPGAPAGAEVPNLQRWLLDPRVGPAVVKLIDAIVQIAAGSGRSVPAASGSRGDMKREYQMGPGHVEYFPTWSFWGRTFVRIVNIGTVPTVVTVNEDRTQLEPGQATTKDGLWAAFPIRVVNTNEAPESLVSVTVT